MIRRKSWELVREITTVHIPDQTDWQSISARTVNNRIKALTKDGVINIRAVVNPEKVGYPVLADVYIEVEPGLAQEVGHQLAKFPEISYVACVVGNVDVSCSVRAKAIPDLFDFVEGHIGQIEGVRRTQTYLLPYKIKEIDTWLPPKAIKMRQNGSHLTLQHVHAD
jgi:DNA-binding Lrp family transcriptional regulator